uniref:Uncharacterized protein n=1 Tax=Arundo donax TaxID=35708 RepID=A0A0A9CS06_ARUDO
MQPVFSHCFCHLLLPYELCVDQLAWVHRHCILIHRPQFARCRLSDFIKLFINNNGRIAIAINLNTISYVLIFFLPSLFSFL